MRRRALALFAIVVLAYLPALAAGFIWDDDSYVTDNPTLRSAGGLWQIWTDPAATPQYYPLVHTSFWVEAHVFGVGSATPFHLVNVLIQAASAVALWRLLARLNVPAAWLAAAVWAVHPVQVESVAWVTERKNVLSGLLYLMAALAYVGRLSVSPGLCPGFPIGRRNPGQSPGLMDGCWRWAFALFVLAMLSKTTAASFPAAVLLVIYWKRGRLARRDVLPLLPFFAVGLAMGLFTAHLERTHVGASGPEFAFSPADRVLIAGRAVWFYAAKLAVPWPLSFIYPRWTIDPRQPWQWAFPAGAVAMVATLWALRRRLGRGPLVAVLFFGGTLFPALGFANVLPMRYSFVADHFQYLACLGLIVGTVAVLPRAASVAILVGCVALSFARCFAYADRVTLWTDTAVRNSRSWMVQANLAQALTEAKRPADASSAVRAELAAAPDQPEALKDAAADDARRGNFARARAESDRLAVVGPDYPPGWVQRAELLAHAGDLAGAEAAARRAVAVGPRFAPAHAVLDKVLALRRQRGR